MAGDTGEVEAVLFLERTQPMYNLTVDEAHTFFVGEGRWLVHNTGGQNCTPQPYGGPGGGHHIHSKQAFADAPNYNPNEALAISNDDLVKNGIYHPDVTGYQQRAFRDLSIDVDDGIRRNTMIEHNRIAVDALVEAGMSRAEARRVVAESLWNLRGQGVTAPTNIPWDVAGSGYPRPGTFR